MESRLNVFAVVTQCVVLYFASLSASSSSSSSGCDRVLIGSNPFNSGNEFQWTILIRVRRVVFALSLASSAPLKLQALRALEARHSDIEQTFTFVSQ